MPPEFFLSDRDVRKHEYFNRCLIGKAWSSDSWKYFAAGAATGGAATAAMPSAWHRLFPFARIAPFLALGVAGIVADHMCVTAKCSATARAEIEREAAASWRDSRGGAALQP